MGSDPVSVVHALLSELLPIEQGQVILRLRPAPEDPPPGAVPPLATTGGVTRDGWGVFAALELVAPWRDQPSRPAVVRPMSDTLGLVPSTAYGDMARVEAYLRGWASAVRQVLSATIETSPHGVLLFRLAFPAVLDLRIGPSAERFEQALLAPVRLGKYIPPDPTLLSQDAVDWIYGRIDEALPRAGRFTLRIAEPVDPVPSALPARGGVYGVPEGLRVALELASHDRAGGPVRDVKQQDVFLVPLSALRNLPRVEACMRGWGTALRELFDTSDPEALECLMPHDLSVERVLTRKSLQSDGDFREALLQHWSRRWTLQ